MHPVRHGKLIVHGQDANDKAARTLCLNPHLFGDDRIRFDQRNIRVLIQLVPKAKDLFDLDR